MAEKYNYYSPLDDAKKIVEYKGLYANEYNKALASGASGTQANAAGQQYRDAAQEYYNRLKSNGYEYLANELANTDYSGGLKLVQNLPQTTAIPQNQYTYGAGTSYTSTTDPSSYMSSLMNVISPYMQQNTAATNAYSSQLADLYSRYGAANDTSTARYNDFWNQASQYGQAQSARYEDLYNYLKTNDYTKSPTYASIMASYGEKGQNAADNAAADAASSNAGNIDSYAAANAKRQQLAFTNAGNSAALAAYDAQINNMLSTLQSLGVDMTNLQTNQVNALTSEANRNAAMLDSYVNGQNGLVAAESQNYGNLANVLGNAMNLYGNMYSEDAANLRNANSLASQDYLGQLDYLLGTDTNDANRYAADKSLEGTKYNSDANVRIQEIANELAKYQTDASTALGKYQTDADIAMNKTNADTNVLLQQLANQLGMYQSNNSLAETKYSANAGIQQSQIQADADRYATDANERMNKANNETSMASAIINSATPSSEKLEPTAVATAIQGIMNGLYGGQKFGIYQAAAILKSMYPNNEDEIDAYVKDYLASNKSAGTTNTTSSGYTPVYTSVQSGTK